MKSLINYITEKANFLVKKHVNIKINKSDFLNEHPDGDYNYLCVGFTNHGRTQFSKVINCDLVFDTFKTISDFAKWTAKEYNDKDFDEIGIYAYKTDKMPTRIGEYIISTDKYETNITDENTLNKQFSNNKKLIDFILTVL